ncbi:MAG: hypothetical protein RIE73_00780 [Coleofasciculus sp. C1-SOL-03]|jgi:hypothetical protein
MSDQALMPTPEPSSFGKVSGSPAFGINVVGASFTDDLPQKARIVAKGVASGEFHESATTDNL